MASQPTDPIPPREFGRPAKYSTRAIHPLDPISPSELGRAAHTLRDKFHSMRLRFKLIDVIEPPKAQVLTYLESIRHGRTTASIPDRKARIYFHKESSPVLQKAVVNITLGTVDQVEELPDSQGPVDYDEFEAVHDACNSHPEVLKEIAKLKLPTRYNLAHNAQGRERRDR